MKFIWWNFYPPFVGAGIKILEVAPDYSRLSASLTQHWWNKNYIGTIFGGSIYSLCDPFHMVLLMNRLGPEFIVRDKGAEIRFLKKGQGRLVAQFSMPNEIVEEIRRSPHEVQERRFTVQVKNKEEEVVAEVTKLLHIRKKLSTK